MTVYAYRSDRLGSSLLNLAHGWRLATRLRTPFVCFWPPFHGKRGNLDLTEILAWPQPGAHFELVHGVDFGKLTGAVNFRQLRNQISVDPSTNDVSNGSIPADILFTDTSAALLTGEKPIAAYEEGRQLLKQLKLTTEVETAISHLAASVDLTRLVSVHIRRGDIVADLQRPNPNKGVDARSVENFVARFADLKAYRRLIQAEMPESDILVFSDDPHTAERFSEMLLPHRTINIKELMRPLEGRLTPTQWDFVELASMSRTRLIIAGGSNFPGFSAFLGGVPQRDARFWINGPELLQTLIEICGARPDASEVISKVQDAYRALYIRRGMKHTLERQ